MSGEALALQWFSQMETGQIDRKQLASACSAQLTDDAVQAMSRQLKRYGASPTSAQVLRSRTTDDQTFYLVKLVFRVAMPLQCSSVSIRKARSQESISSARRGTDA
jgi:hypothetical protein